MKLQHNIVASNANRQLGINQNNWTKNAEKLSTGYRINRAADDASGLTISEKMRGQIRGLNRASKNVQDGLSLLQTAEGALQETHSILQRMRELAVQAANDTNTELDRSVIQEEIDQLTEEIDTIAHYTEFNNGIYPLLGGSWQNDMMKYLTQITATVTCPVALRYDGIIYQPGTPIKMSGVIIKDYLRPENRSLFYMGGYINTVVREDEIKDELIRVFANYREERLVHFCTLTKDDFYADEEGRIYCQKRQIDNQIDGGFLQDRIYFKKGFGIGWTYDKPDKDDPNVLKVKSEKSRPTQLWIQAGANTNQGIFLSTVDATAEGIGIKDLSVMSHSAAGEAIRTIDNAITKVNNYRSDFGAQHNRLEHAMAVDDNTAENLQASESKIRDVDMSDEMAGYTKNNILLETGRSILAQANQSTRGVLDLLSRTQ